ncbi:MAG: heme-binding protein, partial [Planctomycetota bacterium]|nr:heme-binding protein [Planctomycetota bacterium]
MSDISLKQAQDAVAAAIAKADQIGVKMNIAVVDAGANLKAFARMDGAWLGSIDISIKKARTARFFDMNTGA